MCGRFSLAIDAASLKELVKAQFSQEMDAWAPSWNVAPSQRAPLLLGSQELSLRRWGCALDGRSLINVRSEGLSSSRLAMNSLFRCAVPADGFYEWKRSARGSVPYFLSLPDAGRIFFMAALAAPEPEGFAILTRSSSPPLDSVHERAPALLSGEALALWLSPAASNEEAFSALSSPQAPFSMRKADPRVNSVAFNSPEAQAPFSSPEQLELL